MRATILTLNLNGNNVSRCIVVLQRPLESATLHILCYEHCTIEHSIFSSFIVRIENERGWEMEKKKIAEQQTRHCKRRPAGQLLCDVTRAHMCERRKQKLRKEEDTRTTKRNSIFGAYGACMRSYGWTQPHDQRLRHTYSNLANSQNFNLAVST